MNWRWEFWKPEEVLSPMGLTQWERGNLLFQPFALDTFDELRRILQKPLRANHGKLELRGYRSCHENYKASGAPLSRHVQGIALDVTCYHSPVAELFEAIEKVSEVLGIGGIGYYPDRNFVHIDCRPLIDGKPTIWRR
jgi:uncharacterized protein YcbK (DUF882 family)